MGDSIRELEEYHEIISDSLSDAFDAATREEFEPIELFPMICSSISMPFNYNGFGDIGASQRDKIVREERMIVHNAAISALDSSPLLGEKALNKYFDACDLYFFYIEKSKTPASSDFSVSSIPGWDEWAASLY